STAPSGSAPSSSTGSGASRLHRLRLPSPAPVEIHGHPFDDAVLLPVRVALLRVEALVDREVVEPVAVEVADDDSPRIGARDGPPDRLLGSRRPSPDRYLRVAAQPTLDDAAPREPRDVALSADDEDVLARVQVGVD